MPFPVWLDRRIDALLPAAPPANARGQTRAFQLATPAPPAHPPQSAPPARAPQKGAPVREQQATRERQAIGTIQDRIDDVIVACAEREQGQRGEQDRDDGEEDGQLSTMAASDAGTNEELDSALIAALLGQTEDSGMFEVILPGGETLGVAVDVRPEAVDYLLTPASPRLASHLRERQMELAGQLGRQMGRSVRITVL